ncbi:MAG: hypothetical protein M3Z54_06360 [Gemmatimonadota bacterium]|nr:hypothetical protein [Gemmatimonadota bacterium]
MIIRLLTASALVGVSSLLAQRSTSDAPHLRLSSTAPLQAAFNADSGKVRAIFLVSPTCGVCLHGASQLQRAWLNKDRSKDIAVYVVWSPQLGAKEKHVGSATALLPDARARHYWDGEELVGKAYQNMLGLPAPAWDTWMLFDRNTVWRDDKPPAPAWWEHQLGAGPPERHLDPARFASHAEALRSVSAKHQ